MNYDIKFIKGRCLNCDSPISSGILCPKCTPPAETHHQITKSTVQKFPKEETPISSMEIGQVGYTEIYAVFEVSGQLYLIAGATVSNICADYKTVRISRTRRGYEIDSRTIDSDDIYTDWPSEDDPILYLPAILV